MPAVAVDSSDPRPISSAFPAPFRSVEFFLISPSLIYNQEAQEEKISREKWRRMKKCVEKEVCRRWSVLELTCSLHLLV